METVNTLWNVTLSKLGRLLDQLWLTFWDGLIGNLTDTAPIRLWYIGIIWAESALYSSGQSSNLQFLEGWTGIPHGLMLILYIVAAWLAPEARTEKQKASLYLPALLYAIGLAASVIDGSVSNRGIAAFTLATGFILMGLKMIRLTFDYQRIHTIATEAIVLSKTAQKKEEQGIGSTSIKIAGRSEE